MILVNFQREFLSGERQFVPVRLFLIRIKGGSGPPG
jgi:hypothetical protein